MNNACFWREEEIADLLLGKLEAEKRVQLERHVADCDRCAALLRDWSAILAPAEPKPHPSPSLKRRLLQRIVVERWISRLHRLRASAWVWRAAVLLLCIGSLFVLQRESLAPPVPPNAAVTRDVAMVKDPHTVLYVVPVVPGNVKSYVWVNDTSNEILILTEGLMPSAEYDYQVWLITKDKRFDVGLLHWQDGMARLYFQGGVLRQVENFAVSVEPKGGSFVPTGPDAIFVNLR